VLSSTHPQQNTYTHRGRRCGSSRRRSKRHSTRNDDAIRFAARGARGEEERGERRARTRRTIGE